MLQEFNRHLLVPSKLSEKTRRCEVAILQVVCQVETLALTLLCPLGQGNISGLRFFICKIPSITGLISQGSCKVILYILNTQKFTWYLVSTEYQYFILISSCMFSVQPSNLSCLLCYFTRHKYQVLTTFFCFCCVPQTELGTEIVTGTNNIFQESQDT